MRYVMAICLCLGGAFLLLCAGLALPEHTIGQVLLGLAGVGTVGLSIWTALERDEEQ